MHKGTSDNRLLQMFDANARGQFSPMLSVELDAREVLMEPGMPVLEAYFPIDAVVSLVSTMESGASAEVALVGHEGMVGLAGVLGTAETSTSAVVQIPGIAVRVPTAALRAARAVNDSVRKAIDLYTQARFIQMAQTAACSRLHPVDGRLARWLLAIHDRIEGDEFALAQESIADMLGVHRPTVSIALQRIQNERAIMRRGRVIVIADRARLEALACECHRVIDREFGRLLEGRANGREPSTVPGPFLSGSGEPEPAAALEGMREIAGRLLLVSIREQEAREEAEEANRVKDQFLAMVSHELRTPLNAILGWCAILSEKKDESPEHGLQMIARNARAQLKLVEDLLDAARITAATLAVQRKHIKLAELVHTTVDAVRPVAEEKNIALRLTVADDLPPLLADADRLEQVLLNVLANSLKFTDAGGSVDVGVESVPGYARVIVRDSGRGITRAVLPHVFEQFRTADVTHGGQQGLGLGLTIARAIVELHGGTIVIESPGENEGATCTIDLPLDVNPEATPSEPVTVKP